MQFPNELRDAILEVALPRCGCRFLVAVHSTCHALRDRLRFDTAYVREKLASMRTYDHFYEQGQCVPNRFHHTEELRDIQCARALCATLGIVEYLCE
jgi:hypothetical protein